MIVAAAPGFSFGDAFVFGMLFVGVAIVAAIGALSHQKDRAFSASVVYLGLGLVAAVGIELLDVRWFDPLRNYEVLEHSAELAVIIALFATGLKLDRPLTWQAWKGVVRLLAIAMPLTIVAVVVYGTEVMGLSLAGAVALGAVLSPTDPVLAGDIGVGPPGDEEEHEPNFSLTGEAGLNDGLAFPFVFLAFFIGEQAGGEWSWSWAWEWFMADVLYAIIFGLALGAVMGYLLAAMATKLRRRRLFSIGFDGWLAAAAVLIVYGFVEVMGAYGFLAAFAGGLTFRRYERDSDANQRVHHGAEALEKFGELALVMLLASSVTLTGLGVPGVSGWLLVPLLLLVIRPLAVLVSLIGLRLPPGERAFVGWFGVRGIGSLYYLAVVIGFGVLTVAEMRTLFWTVTVCVLVSIVVHGLTATPLSRRWLPAGQAPGD